MSGKYTLMRQNCRKKSDDTAGKSSLLRSWGDKDPLKRPACALLVTLAQGILRHADTHTLTTMVSSRQGGCLHEVSHIHTHVPYFLVVKWTVGSCACNTLSVTPLILTPILPSNVWCFVCSHRQPDVQTCTAAAWCAVLYVWVQMLFVIAA